eukprot:m.64236 g.64236  ORF g.64236 m.64236 type:complete len:1384 (+) comp35230_c0_seq1:760-4911(+)
MVSNNDNITFHVTVPAFSIEYTLYLRYQAAATVEVVTFEITGAYDCRGVMRSPILDSFTAIASDFGTLIDIPLGCLQGNRNLTAVFQLREQEGSMINEIFIDSIILFPNRENVPAYATLEFDLQLEADDCYDQREAVPTHAGSLSEFCRSHTLLASACIFNGTLDCNCDPIGANSTICESLGGQCSCRPNVIGRTCSDCAFNHTQLSLTGCRPCDCFPTGTRDGEPCDPVTGNCPCKDNYVGPRCDMCAVNFFDLSMCRPCGCDPDFSSNLQCNDSGVCTCQSGIAGIKCDGGCMTEFFNLTTSGCTPCECDPTGSVDAVCNVTTGQCECSGDGVDRRKCDRCIEPGFFGFGQFKDAVCRRCFCNNHSNTCDAADVEIITKIETIESRFEMGDDGWTGKSAGNPNSGVAQFELDERNVLVGFTFADLEFFVAPSKFLGDQSGAYGRTLTFDLAISNFGGGGSTAPLSSNPEGDVKLQKVNESSFLTMQLQLKQNAPLSVDERSNLLSYEVLLVEGSFTEQPGGQPVSRMKLMDILSNLGGIYIRAQFGQGDDANVAAFLDDVVLTRAVNVTNIETINGENCTCPYGFKGLSCQFCAEGFKREVPGGNASVPCVLCECNGHSNLCDAGTGVCINCTDNTEGDFCERCKPQFFGDATNGSVCQPCNCDPDGSLAPECDRTTGKCNCSTGFSGRDCSVCSDGFFNKSAGCLMCQCNTSNTINNSNVCEKEFGVCPCISGIAGRTCDFCRRGLIGFPPTCIDCGDCFTNWTDLIDKLLCDGVEKLAERIDGILLNLSGIQSRLLSFVRCVKKEVTVTMDLVMECKVVHLQMIDDGAIEQYKMNVSQLRNDFDSLCAKLQTNVSYIERKLGHLEATEGTADSEEERLKMFFLSVEGSLNKTESLLATTRSFNGSIQLSDGSYTNAMKLEEWATQLNNSASTLQREIETDVAMWIAQIQADKTRVEAAEEKALKAQTTVDEAVMRAQAAKDKVSDVNETKANFSRLFDENEQKLTSLKQRSSDIDETLTNYLMRAQNATTKAMKANETATNAGKATQDKYMAASNDKDLANNLKTNASLALKKAEEVYNGTAEEKDLARDAYLKAKSVVNDTAIAKADLEGAEKYVMMAEGSANDTLDTELPPVSDILDLARKINETALGVKEDVARLNESAEAAKERAEHAKYLAMKAWNISKEAEALVDDIVKALNDSKDKNEIAEENLTDVKDMFETVKDLEKMVNAYAEEVHTISMESKNINKAANKTIHEAHECRAEAKNILEGALEKSCSACAEGPELRRNLSTIFGDAFSLDVQDAKKYAQMDKTVADELLVNATECLGKAPDKETMDKLMNLLDEVRDQKAKLQTQKTELMKIENKINLLEEQAEENCAMA